MSELFYSEIPPGDYFEIGPDEAKHLIRVLRYEAGDVIHITDGKGTLFTAVLESTDYHACKARVTGRTANFRKRPYRIHLAIAPTKNMDRLEWFLEKATEIGIDRITPIICRRSERRELRADRLQKILLSAMKQSFQTQLPELDPTTPFEAAIKAGNGKKFICHLDETNPVPLKSVLQRGEDAFIVIGPEGDFAPEELKLALDTGFTCVSLGSTRLRTETAGIVACSTISIVNQ